MSNSTTKKTGIINVFIEIIESLGNKLPHPFWLFVFLCVITLVASSIFSYFGVSVEYMSAQATGAAMTTVKENILI